MNRSGVDPGHKLAEVRPINPVNEAQIACLEELLKHARAGRVQKMILYYEADRGCEYMFVGNALDALALTHRLQHIINEIWSEAGD